MTWLHFFIWVAGVYVLYYLAVFLIDLAGANRAPAADLNAQELTFSENVVPAKLNNQANIADKPASKIKSDDALPRKMPEPEMIGSGGVVIDGLFKLCKQEAIVYTRSVSF